MKRTRRRLAIAGGILIIMSGFVSIFIGIRGGFIQTHPDPAGLFGHIGVLTGIKAVVIGGLLTVMAFYKPAKPIWKIVLGLFTVVFGHLGAIAGALLVGTAGLLLCYIAVFWLMGIGIRQWKRHDA